MLCTRMSHFLHSLVQRNNNVVLVLPLLSVHTAKSMIGDLIAANVLHYTPRRTSNGQQEWQGKPDPKRTRSGLGKQAPWTKSNGRGKQVVLWLPRRTSNVLGKRAPKSTSNGRDTHVVLWLPRRIGKALG